MGNILNDIVEEVNIKPNKTKLVLKWGISIAGSLITVAFVFGQFKASFFNRMDKFEKAIIENTVAIEELKTEMNGGFDDVNTRIDNGYSEGLSVLQDYQEFNKKQLILVLDYGQTNKKLLKEMLEINMLEKTKSVENQIMQAKNDGVVEKQNGSTIIEQKKSKDYLSLVHTIQRGTNDTTFRLTGASMEFINNIDKNKYRLGAVIENQEYPKLYDVSYKNK